MAETEIDEEAAFEEPLEEKTPEEEITEDEGKERRSEIAQKKHWRGKAQAASTKVEELTAELETLKSAVKKPDDEKEAAAQEYIRNQAKAVYKELQAEKAKEEAKELAAFEGKVQDVLTENPDVSEEELLDAIEEYEVEPLTALKIIQKQSKEKDKKPKMPQARRASPTEDKDKPDDSKKSIWQIAQDEIAKFKDK